jgi:hypothetical protein
VIVLHLSLLSGFLIGFSLEMSAQERGGVLRIFGCHTGRSCEPFLWNCFFIISQFLSGIEMGSAHAEVGLLVGRQEPHESFEPDQLLAYTANSSSRCE